MLNIPSCTTIRDMMKNISLNLSEPEKVKNKVHEPIRDGVHLSMLWVGHATVLLQMDDKAILIDPFFTNNVAEIQRRVKEPGMDLDDLKKCDLIIISHSHFDHLNYGTLRMLEDKFSGTDLVFPEGMEEFIPDLNFTFNRIYKAGTNGNKYSGKSSIVNGVKITAVKAYHWGGRYGLDGLIWGYSAFTGYIIEYNGMIVYFTGDTAYDENAFKYLGIKYNIDLALIPIGPCRDCEALHKENRHVYPKGALKILDDTKAKLFVPIHYGTLFEKSDSPDEPKYVLRDMILKKPEYRDRVKIMEIGEQIILK
jgi:N-acyl-phosphatidylethanolamine-hydrolysing phospholipase D